MNMIEGLPVISPGVEVGDGESSMPAPIAKQFNELIKGKGAMHPDEIIACVGLAAEIVNIKTEKQTGRPASSISDAINSGIAHQPK
jgi:hypothetical protein